MAGLGIYCMGRYGRIGVYRVNQEICGQKPTLYDILWKILTFMKFCGDYYDIYENKRIFISKASWQILNRTFFDRILSIMEVYKLPWLQKKEYQE